MPFRDWFEEENGQYTILKLKPEDSGRFTDFLPSNFRTCYISDEEISRAVVADPSKQLDARSVIANCIPDTGSVMAGDFGELTCCLLLRERYEPLALESALKWRWKEDRNRAMGKTDVVLFQSGTRPSPDDLIVAAESKTKATSNPSYDPIQAAIEGAEKDSVSRLAKTLSWLREKYIRSGDTASADKLLRFINSQEDNLGPYKKHHKAVIFIDSELLNNELAITRTIPTIENFEVLILSIPNLQATYEAVFNKVPDNV